MYQSNQPLCSAETAKREQLRRNKPHVYEKILKYAEKVERGESIAIIQFQYNYVCNFKCEHCSVKHFQGKNSARKFTIPDVRDLSRQADELGLANIVITGGEPLVFKDFDELVGSGEPVETRCQFCGKPYVFTPEELTAARAQARRKKEEENDAEM